LIDDIESLGISEQAEAWKQVKTKTVLKREAAAAKKDADPWCMWCKQKHVQETCPKILKMKSQPCKKHHFTSVGCPHGDQCFFSHAKINEVNNWGAHCSLCGGAHLHQQCDKYCWRFIEKRCQGVNENPKCNRIHKHLADFIRKDEKEQKESETKGPRFTSAHYRHLIGWVAAPEQSSNCVFLWGKVIINKHLLQKKDGSPLDEGAELQIQAWRLKPLEKNKPREYNLVIQTYKVADAKQFWYDHMMLPMQGSLLGQQSIKAGTFDSKTEVSLMAYDSHEAFLRGEVQNMNGPIVRVEDCEVDGCKFQKAIYEMSSVRGNCCGVGVNGFGHAVLTHNFRRDAEATNGGIVLSPDMMYACTGQRKN
jgi:hypothetical protein